MQNPLNQLNRYFSQASVNKLDGSPAYDRLARRETSKKTKVVDGE